MIPLTLSLGGRQLVMLISIIILTFFLYTLGTITTYCWAIPRSSPTLGIPLWSLWFGSIWNSIAFFSSLVLRNEDAIHHLGNINWLILEDNFLLLFTDNTHTKLITEFHSHIAGVEVRPQSLALNLYKYFGICKYLY